MISNSAKLDSRTKQHTQSGVSTSDGSRAMAATKSWRKKRKKKNNNEVNWMVSYSAKLDSRTKQHTQFGVSASNDSRDMARTKVATEERSPRTLVQLNVVRSRLIILINEEINKAKRMVSNSAKLDSTTKQHTQFGVTASNGSIDMARKKLWRKKKIK